MVMKNTLAGLVACLAMMPAFAADVTIPHTFTSGTPARAAEVNANFTALKTGTDANAAAIDALKAELQALALSMRGGLQVQVNGVTIGVLFGMDEGDNLLALTTQGYFVVLYPNKADETAGAGSALQGADISFDAADCQGNPYVTGVAMYSEHNLFFRQGIVFGAPGPAGATVAWRAKGEPSPVTLYSGIHLGDDSVWRCYNHDGGSGTVGSSQLAIVPVPNDPSVTGVPNNLSGPVRIAP